MLCGARQQERDLLMRNYRSAMLFIFCSVGFPLFRTKPDFLHFPSYGNILTFGNEDKSLVLYIISKKN